MLFSLLHKGDGLEEHLFSPEMFLKGSKSRLPHCPSRLCDVKLMLDVTQKGPEPWFRAPGPFQRCSKSHCWIKPAYRNAPQAISQSFQVEFTRTCWPPPLKRKNEPTKEGEKFLLVKEESFLLPISVKTELALSICIQVALLLLSSNRKWIENGETNHVKNFLGSSGKSPTKLLQPSLGELHGFWFICSKIQWTGGCWISWFLSGEQHKVMWLRNRE